MDQAPDRRPRVGLSSAVPAREELDGSGWSRLDTRLAVQKIAERLLRTGAILVHGSHPTLSVLIQQLSGSDLEAPKRVGKFASRVFIRGEYERDFVEEHAPYAAVTLTGEPDMDRSSRNRDAALTELHAAVVST